MRVSLGVVIVLSLGAAHARAQSEAPAPAAPAAVAPAAPKPAETAATAPPQEEIRSESKFLAVLYAEIARQSASEEEKELGEGETTASFHIDATGKIDKVTIDKTTSEAHAAAVKRILALVKVPRPPGGGMDVGQTFKFH
jgi:outer membrane biosynthesis protein TonB